MINNLNLRGIYRARLRKRHCPIEEFLETIEGRFGLKRFAQRSKLGVTRRRCPGGLALLMRRFGDPDLPIRPPKAWPDWGNMARTVDFSFFPNVRRQLCT